MAEEKNTRTVTLEIDEDLYKTIHREVVWNHYESDEAYIQRLIRRAMVMEKKDEMCLNDEGWLSAIYIGVKMWAEAAWVDGEWYEWMDINGKTGKARIKLDAYDHFYPNPDNMVEEEIIAFRPIRYPSGNMSPIDETKGYTG